MNNKLIGIKSSLDRDQINNKLDVNPQPELLEIFLVSQDYDKPEFIENRLLDIHTLYPNIKIMLHAPVDKDKQDTIHLQDSDFDIYYSKLYKLCKKLSFVIGFVAHPEPEPSKKSSRLLLENNLAYLKQKYPSIMDYMYVENLANSLTLSFENYINCIEKNNISNICFDFAHFVSSHSREELNDALEEIRNNEIIKKAYFHISDNDFNCEKVVPLNIGKGSINFESIIHFLDFGILETISSNEKEGVEMREDYKKIISISNLN